LALREFEAFDSEAAAKRNITRAIEQVSARLGNTVAICRKCYVHPALFEAYLDGTLAASLKQKVEATLAKDLETLSPEEAAVLAFLEHRLGEVAADRSP
jgi:DNA topoisomerase-1